MFNIRYLYVERYQTIYLRLDESGLFIKGNYFKKLYLNILIDPKYYYARLTSVGRTICIKIVDRKKNKIIFLISDLESLNQGVSDDDFLISIYNEIRANHVPLLKDGREL